MKLKVRAVGAFLAYGHGTRIGGRPSGGDSTYNKKKVL